MEPQYNKHFGTGRYLLSDQYSKLRGEFFLCHNSTCYYCFCGINYIEMFAINEFHYTEVCTLYNTQYRSASQPYWLSGDLVVCKCDDKLF